MTQNEANEANGLFINYLQSDLASNSAKPRALAHRARIRRGQRQNEAKRSQCHKLLDFSKIAPNRGKRSQFDFALCFERFIGQFGPYFAKSESIGPKSRIVTLDTEFDNKIRLR